MDIVNKLTFYDDKLIRCKCQIKTGDIVQSGWFVVGGTSFSAPAWAAMIALIDQGRTTNKLSSVEAISALYSFTGTTIDYTDNYHDITQGNNGYSAMTGYDLVTGIGSPVANNLIPNL
ncbi:MAG: hypothetical protein P4L59_07775 [Desulfosporosinus sp.]|nr:hypothetical protein [Desulfosporosinus sp.]